MLGRVRAAVRGWVLGLVLAGACGGREPAQDRELVEAARSRDPVRDGEASVETVRPRDPVQAADPTAQGGGGEQALDGDRADSTTSTLASPATERAPATPPEPEPKPAFLDLVFVGDVVLGEYVFDGHRSFAGPLAPGDPFIDVAELLEADLVVGNLESPVMHEIPEKSPLHYGHRFGASAPAVAGLAAGGFDVMSVANNHANDLGREGLEQTPEVLRAVGITPVGEARHAGSPLRMVTLEHRGWKLGLLSATTWLNHAPTLGDPSVPVVGTSRLKRALVPLVEEARADHDLVIVLLHWGRERRERPEPAQIHAAHALVDAGADLVIGHHPHVLQGIERYGDGLIAYSLGNFLFPAREDAFRDSAVLRVRVSGELRGVVEAVLCPVRLSRPPGFMPRRPPPAKQRTVHEQLQRLSARLSTRLTRKGVMEWPTSVVPGDKSAKPSTAPSK
jgi:hypothetical protein